MQVTHGKKGSSRRSRHAREGCWRTKLRRCGAAPGSGFDCTGGGHFPGACPSSDAEDRKRYDADMEAIAMQWVRAFEEALGATMHDVSTAERALAAGLEAWPGFDFLSRRASGEELAIEVKGRAGIGDVE